MIQIEGRFFASIKIDGKELTGPNLIRKVVMCEGLAVTWPSLLLELNDLNGQLISDLCLTDGNEILITLGTSPEDLKTVTRQYRYLNRKMPMATGGGVATILAFLDAPKYTIEAPRESYEGTSSQVLKELAAKCKLEYDGPENFNGRSVADSQVWINIGNKRGVFAQHEIARHGYIDEHSAMIACVSSLGVLKYRNLMDVIETPESKIKYVFTHNMPEGDQDSSKQVYKVREARDGSDAGILNAWINYGSTTITSRMDGTTAVDDSVKVKTSAKYIPINDQVAKTVQRARVSVNHIDCGNTHEKYERAEYQNIKQMALFTERQSLLVFEPTEVQLFDPVIYRQATTDPTDPVKNTDIYIVAAKTLFTNASNYCERIELIRMSLTEKGEAALKGTEPTAIRESAIPDVEINPTISVASSTLSVANTVNGMAAAATSAYDTVRLKAVATISSLRSCIPSMTTLTSHLPSFASDPHKTIQSVRAGINAVKNAVERVQDMRQALDTAKDAYESGNLTMIAGSIPGVVRSAVMFREYGPVDGLCASLGATSAVGDAASIYNTIGSGLTAARGAIDAATNAGAEVDEMIGEIDNLNNEYQAVVGGVASTVNSTIQTVTGESPNLSVPRLDYNRIYVGSLIDQSLAKPATGLNAVRGVTSIKDTLPALSSAKDETRNYPWAPTSGYTTKTTETADAPAAVTALANNIELAARQSARYSKEKGGT